MIRFRIKIDNVDFVFAETQRRLERFNESRTIFVVDRDAILNDLHPRAQPLDFFVGIGAYDLIVDPDAEVTLLLEKIEKRARLRFRGDVTRGQSSFK